MSVYRKKLIEVALPLDAINRESAREKSIRHGHPSTLHLWWARRPLAACRAVLFGQLVDDPSAWPDRFPGQDEQDRERQRIFRIIEELVKWENSNNEVILDAARIEIARSFARGRVADGEGGSRDEEVLREEASPKVVRAYLAEVVPAVHDPFAGGGSIPLEALRLGLRAIATDLNPVAVLINKALIEIPPRFARRAPVGPRLEGTKQTEIDLRDWPGASGMAEDVRRYGAWMRDEAVKRIGDLYPQVDLPPDHGGGKATVVAWLWARTVPSPNPAFRKVHVPLVSNFFLSIKKDREVWVEPVIDGHTYHFEVRTGKSQNRAEIKRGTKLGRGANFRCILSDIPIEPDYIKAEGMAGRLGARLMAVVAQGQRKRIYLPPPELDPRLSSLKSEFVPDLPLPGNRQYCNPPLYGLETFADLFTPRQLVALTTFSDLVLEAREKVVADALAAGWSDDGTGLDDGGAGARAYGDAVATYLAFGLSKLADYSSTICRWFPERDSARSTFSRQALPISWDYAELNPLENATGSFTGGLSWTAKSLEGSRNYEDEAEGPRCRAYQADAGAIRAEHREALVVSTDPPYFDNVPYADLSDYFYVWLRRSLKEVFPALFDTIAVPKQDELVASPLRHGGKSEAESFFMEGMTRAVGAIEQSSVLDVPITIYYAFKQAEAVAEGVSSTGWERFLSSLVESDLVLTGTWPLRTELGNRMRSIGSNALASSILLVCRARPDHATSITRGDFRRLLRDELPRSLQTLHKGNIAPVDLAQASIGPGMAIFSRHSGVLEVDGSAMSVRSALQLINEVVGEVGGEQEGEFDRDTRFAATWFESHGFSEGPYGEAETLATARAVSVSGVEEAGIVKSAAGRVRLYTREELPGDWDPATDERLTVWEATQHLIKRLAEDGEGAAAVLLSKLGTIAESARDLAYRLFTICELRGWAEEASAYNGLVLAWPELEKLAGEVGTKAVPAPQAELFE